MPLSFAASFASGRKCLTLDTDGEAIITLAIPESDAPKVTEAFRHLRDVPFKVTISVGGENEQDS